MGMCVLSHSVVSNSVIPWIIAHQVPLSMEFFIKNIGVGFYFQGILPTQGSSLCLLHLLHWQWILYH